MSIGFPLAPATTGLSSVEPSQIQVRFRTRRCSGVSSDSIPMYWLETISLEDALPALLPTFLGLPPLGTNGILPPSPSIPTGLVGKGIWVIKDDALALMDVGNPTPNNEAALNALATQIAMDFVAWRSVSFDIVLNGIIASPPNGIMDMCQWTMNADEVSTRQITQPLNGEPEEFNHNDPANAGCVDVPGSLYVTKTPCIETYIPLWMPGGTLGAYRAKICLEDGRLVEYYTNNDLLSCGCGGAPACSTFVSITITTCDPTQEMGIAVTITDSHSTVVGSGTTNHLGQIVLGITCDASLTYTINISKSGFTTINEPIAITCCNINVYSYYLTASSDPMITVNIHVASCESGEYAGACTPCNNVNTMPGISDVLVSVLGGPTSYECTTNANGDCTIVFPSYIKGTIYTYSTGGGACVLAYDGSDSFNDTCTTQTITECLIVPADPSCHCFCCQNPRPGTLFLTDSVYGDVTLTWNGTRYTGSIVGAGFIGGCGCPAAPVTITYQLDCTCGAMSLGPYELTICYTAYGFTEFCGGPPFFLQHDCPGPINLANPTSVCVPAKGCAECSTNILLLDCGQLFNTTFGCAVPTNIIFTFNQTCGGGVPCVWLGTACPSPWIGAVTFTITE